MKYADTTGAAVRLTGDWAFSRSTGTSSPTAQAHRQLLGASEGVVDISAITALDTAGAVAIANAVSGKNIEITGAAENHATLLKKVMDARAAAMAYSPPAKAKALPFEKFGRSIASLMNGLRDAAAMQGRLIAPGEGFFTGGSGFRIASLVTQFDRMIFQAVPIVALMTFLVGAIVTQQSIFQLRTFGASIFVVDLAAILVLREVGVLLAAIMIAGRSGSAITAELGSMRMREEVDALRVMGLDPYTVLLLPRVLALVIGLPLLAFIASVAGISGAAVVAKLYGGIPYATFLDRLGDTVTFNTFAVGMIKAPFMAFIIGLIACLEGMKIEGSSESLGRHTTSSVVKAIFLVIVADGIFAMFFAAINI